jgi:hypothetical protein
VLDIDASDQDSSDESDRPAVIKRAKITKLGQATEVQSTLPAKLSHFSQKPMRLRSAATQSINKAYRTRDSDDSQSEGSRSGKDDSESDQDGAHERGLVNPPRTKRGLGFKWICFFNAPLQAIQAVASQEASRIPLNDMEGAPQQFNDILQGLGIRGSPLDALSLLQLVNPKCLLGEQQDAQEYMQLLFERIDGSWNNPFRVVVQTSVQCVMCGETSPNATSSEEFMVPLELGMFNTPLQDSIDRFAQPRDDYVHENNRFRCPRKCSGSVRKAAKDSAREKSSPRIWSQRSLHLVNGDAVYRLAYLVRFHNTLSKDSSRVHVEEQHTFKGLDLDTKMEVRSLWDTMGIVVHTGTLAGGHYVTYAKRGDKWWKFDDAKVTRQTWRQVRKGSVDAYIVVFKKVKRKMRAIDP